MSIVFSIDEENLVKAAQAARRLGLSSASLYVKYVFLAVVNEGNLPSGEEILRAHDRQQERKEEVQWQKSGHKTKLKPIS